MSPKEAKVFIIDDEELYTEKIQQVLEASGHEVVEVSHELFDVTEKIRSGRVKDLDTQVVTVDGKLSQWDPGGVEGAWIVKELHKHVPEVKIIGVSNMYDIDGVDENLRKRDLDKLGDLVTKL